jgi:isoleucyl-tRNA synthetase
VAVNGHAPYRRVLTHGFTLDEKGRKMSKSLGNVVDPTVLVEGGGNQKKDPPYGADVLRLWVSSVDYSADVPLGPGIVKQLADVYRKVRNTARYLLGNLHDFDPALDAIPIAELPLLDRWMLQRTAQLIEAVSADFERFEFYRFFQALQNFCVVDLSNVYLDIAKDRLYVSGASEFRRRSCQTVLHLVVERLAGLIAPVLCHMAEDIWQNLPYAELRDLLTAMNPGDHAATDRNHVDELRYLFLVSQVEVLDSADPLQGLTYRSESDAWGIGVTDAEGEKCDRCWNYSTHIGESADHPTICDRCVGALAGTF